MRCTLGLIGALASGCIGDIGSGDPPEMFTPPAGGDSDDEFTQQSAYAAEKCPGGRAHPAARGLRIREVAIYQTLKIPLYDDGRWLTTRDVPLVEGKRALVRIAVELLEGYEPHEVRGVVRLHNESEVSALVDKRALTKASSDGALSSTFNISIEAGMLDAATRISVGLEEADCDAAPGDPEVARLPGSGSAPLGAEPYNKLRIVLVPMSANGRVPMIGDAQLAKMRAALLAFYPVAEVELQLHKPIDGLPTTPGSWEDHIGWEEQLDLVKSARARDKPDHDLYYFGLFQPALTRQAYCGNHKCMIGLSQRVELAKSSQRSSVGVFFDDAVSYETLVHELGHAHGLQHSPCNGEITAAGIDPTFPSPQGDTQVWGYDLRSKALRPPSFKDIMSYCEPHWINPHVYRALAERNRQLAEVALPFTNDTTRWRSILVHADGSARWGAELEPERPGGEAEAASVLDRAGQEIARIEVVRAGLSHSSGAYVYVPEPGADWVSIRLADRTLDLGAIAPPR